jgi:GPR1/FUN34/yaaH family
MARSDLIRVADPVLPARHRTAGGMLPANHALALDLFCWGFFTLYMWFASFRVSVVVNLVFLTLWIAHLLLGLGLLGGGPHDDHRYRRVSDRRMRADRLVGGSRARDQRHDRQGDPVAPLPR